MTLATAPGTQALLALEDAAPDVLFENLPGERHPLWPQVRSQFMVAMQHLDFGHVDLGAPQPRRAHVWANLVRAVLPSRLDARGARGQRSVLYVAGGRTVYQVDGRERNWLLGDFLDSAPDTSALLQWAPASSTKPAFRFTRSLAPGVTRAAAYARLSRRSRSATLEAVEPLVREFGRLLDVRVERTRIDAIVGSIEYQEASRPHVESQVLRVVDRLQPRIVVMEDASYGTWSSLVARLKERGILVVEPQHGWIGPSHGAYNFGAAMWKSELAVGLPDELLTFGRYWGTGLRTPFSVTPIGKPHLERSAARAKSWAERERAVLVVSSVVDPEGTSAFTAALAGALPDGWTVRFRPHPSERPVIARRYPDLVGHPGVEIDANADVYDSLGAARAVVGVASTVLFEALAFGCRVFAREDATSKYYVGDLFGERLGGEASAVRLAERVCSEPDPSSDVLRSEIWKPNAAANFSEWLGTRLGD